VATAPFFEDVVDLETDITDHLEAQAVADGIAEVLDQLGLSGHACSLSPAHDRIIVEFDAVIDPTIAATVAERFDGPDIACLAQSHSATGSRFEFGAVPQDAMPSRAEAAADDLRDSGFVPTFRILPSKSGRGWTILILDQDGDAIPVDERDDRESAHAAIMAMMVDEGVPDWGIYDEEGVLDLHGRAADAIALETDDPFAGLDLGHGSEDLDLLADVHEREIGRETSDAQDADEVRDAEEAERDAHLRSLRKAA
jgi:hypothetical protein